MRRARLGAGQDVLLVDTVGFIQKLPHQLVAAFRATLEEVTEADLLLHVMDASADDMDEREAAVNDVLKEIGADERPRIDVLNKIDQLGRRAPARRCRRRGPRRCSCPRAPARASDGLERRCSRVGST